MTKTCVLIMAGGLGKRMNSDLPKVLHKLNDKTLIQCVIETANKLNPDKIGIIVGKYKYQIDEWFKKLLMKSTKIKSYAKLNLALNIIGKSSSLNPYFF